MVRWYLDGRELKRFEGRSEVSVAELWLFDLRTHRLSVTAEDRTPSVRDPKTARTLHSTVEWKVRL